MAKTLKAILNKTSWTGEEVGRALLYNLKHDIEFSYANPEELNEPLFPQEKFIEMIASISESPKHFKVYNIYSSLYAAITGSFDKNEGHRQQFYNGYYRMMHDISELHRAEEARHELHLLPLVMTKSEYNAVASEIKSKKRNRKYNTCELISEGLKYFLHHPEKVADGTKFLINSPDKAVANIQTALDHTKQQVVTNPRIIKNYSRGNRNGFYVSSDGVRSDEISEEEWCEHLYGAIDDDSNKRGFDEHQMRNCTLLFKGESAIREAYKKELDEELPETVDFNIEEEFEKAMYGGSHIEQFNRLAQGDYDNKEITWHSYYSVPNDLNKYGILEENDLLELYFSDRKGFTEFRKDYPELFAALIDYVKEKIPAVVSLKANQYFRDIVTGGELETTELPPFCDETTVNDTDLIDYYLEEGSSESLLKGSQIFNGIAIIQESNTFAANTKHTRNISNLLFTIEKLASDPERIEINIRCRENLVCNALSYLYAYNAFISMVCEELNINFLSLALADTDVLEAEIERYNKALVGFYFAMTGTKEEKAYRRAILKSCFQLIDIEKLKPEAEKLDVFRRDFQELLKEDKADVMLRDYTKCIAALTRM